MTLKNDEWRVLARNDWQDILELSKKKSFQRKFQIVGAYIELVAKKGLNRVTHADIAKVCEVTRQLIEHHFPSDELLFQLAYRYLYAGFQKFCSDAVVLKSNPADQFKAYLNAVVGWVSQRRLHARFLAQHFAMVPVFSDLQALHERNIEIGRERILLILIQLREQGHVRTVSDKVLMTYASSIQQQIAGFIVLTTARQFSPSEAKQMSIELHRCCSCLVGGIIFPATTSEK